RQNVRLAHLRETNQGSSGLPAVVGLLRGLDLAELLFETDTRIVAIGGDSRPGLAGRFGIDADFAHGESCPVRNGRYPDGIRPRSVPRNPDRPARTRQAARNRQ